MRNVRAARRYAVALLAESARNNLTDAVFEDLEMIGRVVKGSRELRLLIASPVVSDEKKSRVFDALLRAHVRRETLSFLHLLIEKHREPLLADIIDQFAGLRNEMIGLAEVDVTSAVELAPVQVQAIRERLEHYTQKNVKLRCSLDASIKGGVVVRIGDTVLDGSVKHQLALLRERLVGDQAL